MPGFCLFIGGLFNVSDLMAPKPPTVLSKDFQLLPSCFHSPLADPAQTSVGQQGGQSGKALSWQLGHCTAAPGPP